MKYITQNIEIDLDLEDQVFKPSPHGAKFLGDAIEINKDETVLDIGCGSGILAILSAKKGGKVYATDVLQGAVELTKKNATKNGVEIDVRQGNLEEPFQNKKFDVVIANVPQEILSPKLLNKYDAQIIIGMHGGTGGNEILISALKSCPKIMHENTRMYIVVYSMSNARESLSYISKNFKARLISFETSSVKDFVYEDSGWYEEGSNKGEISIYKIGDLYYADVYVFELRTKSLNV